MVLIVGVMIYTYVDFLEQNKTHYAVLGVDQTATSAEIRSAYRRMSLLHHPDKKSQQRREGASGNAPDGEGSHGHRGDNNNQAFYDIVEAYEVLSDDDRRSQYDQELFERAQHREEMRNRYRDQSRRPPRPGDHERHTGNSFHHHFSLSWHLLHLLPMAHPSLQYWASHLMSYLTCVAKAGKLMPAWSLWGCRARLPHITFLCCRLLSFVVVVPGCCCCCCCRCV